MSMSQRFFVLLAVISLHGACTPLLTRPAQNEVAVPAQTADSLYVDPLVDLEFHTTLAVARWHLLRGLDERALENWNRARVELDQSFRLMARLEDSRYMEFVSTSVDLPAEAMPEAQMNRLGASVERTYISLLPHLERLSPDSPLSLLLQDLSAERIEDLPHDAQPMVRIHQLAPQCDIPVDANPRVAASIHFFHTRGRETFPVWSRRAGRYHRIIDPILKKEGIPRDLFYLAMIESGFRPRAFSRAGASGLWQFVPHTGRLEGLRIDHFVDERRDPVKSTRAAARHLKSLYVEFGDWRLAAAAYNSGRGRVERAIEAAGTRDYWKLQLPRETQNYVPLLMAVTVISKDPERFGFEPIVPDDPVRWEQVTLKRFVSLRTTERLLGLPQERLKTLNPELKAMITPPGRHYELNVPPGFGSQLLARLADLPAPEHEGIYEHIVQRGENLWEISRTFGVDVGMIGDASGISNRGLIHPGQTLYIPISGSFVPPGEAPIHMVQRGESLSLIARRYRISVDKLRAWNRLNGDLIHPRQKLRVGTASKPFELATRNRAPSTSSSQEAVVHVVRSGESLWSLSRNFDVSLTDLRDWNRLHSDVIRVGQKLVVTKPHQARGKLYTVVGGDTLFGIARNFGVNARDIARENNMSLSTTLLSGMRLRIPESRQLD
ncbi:MAG: LysM peptidoglycan-binding domain-containing protein [Candidatus Latescibacterota bacterium]|nr:LysM peptidoglycan-binding domain-containing protein [Candidatus Latescibacterota bacterium]